MPTIDDRALVDEIIAGEGYYKTDPLCKKIVQYTNAWGGTAYGLIYEGMPDDLYAESEYVRNPQTIWEA